MYVSGDCNLCSNVRTSPPEVRVLNSEKGVSKFERSSSSGHGDVLQVDPFKVNHKRGLVFLMMKSVI